MRKARSLIKLLALAPGHRLHREQVMETLWPDLGMQKASNNLHYALHTVRRALEPSALASGSAASSGYLFLRDEQLTLCPDSPLWVDAEAFEEAAATASHASVEPAPFRAAIDLYSGEPCRRTATRSGRRRNGHTYEGFTSRCSWRCPESTRTVKSTGRPSKRWGGCLPKIRHTRKRTWGSCGCMPSWGGGGKLWGSTSGSGMPSIGSLARARGRDRTPARGDLGRHLPTPDSPLAAGSPLEDLRAAAAGGRHNLPLARTTFIGRERETPMSAAFHLGC